MASKMASRTLNAFILGRGLPSCVAACGSCCVICCTRGFSARSCRNSGCAVVELLDLLVGEHHLADAVRSRRSMRGRASQIDGQLEHLEDCRFDRAARGVERRPAATTPPSISSLAEGERASRPAASARSLPSRGSWRHRTASGR